MLVTKDDLSEQLYQALSKNEPLDFKNADPSALSLEHAYEVQHAFNAKKKEAIKGYKISLTSKQTQDMFNSDSPLYGQVVASSVLHDGAELALATLNEPLLELELEFTALEDLSPEDNEEQLLAKTDVAPGIEVPDSRFKDWFPKLPLELVISDSAVCGRLVVGKPAAKKPTVDELAHVHADVTLNGKPLTSGEASEVLGNPLHALKWLVARLAQEGKIVGKGTTVSTGTFCLPKKLEKGTYVATFTHHLGDVTLHVN
ncbi:2-keto-4-pentenoate hydratase [Sporolactobacillus inulinus]|jgi:2-oxo-hept-3-ene-1,7-dioate hydratase|uniref:2-oxo-hepta-3-ene-1,7-dioic acid hydratase n=2 Tax=Sporolactobacillus inulinus TaxID=2078 RepID=A0A4Y1Z7W4_9BACL|nr:2-keto-4-pentenoate hydratase [Sporolactobacillus inulinus]KLI02317.1 2-keto-4-pentenoate hydratase [Sporolactobacillus inulinus CASD]GAY75075.1 2-oxo-hepta-3-ene-1,7-dioic acid hydratase [Sporolactobacillus inulinus]GEB75656.1 2-keto-4-pentenoate hydratase [Sporolactobacillus inulinus]